MLHQCQGFGIRIYDKMSALRSSEVMGNSSLGLTQHLELDVYEAFEVWMIKVLLAVCRTLLARLSLEVEGYAQGPSPGLPHSLLHRSRMPGALHRGATKQKSPGNLGAIFYLDLEFGAETLISGPHSCGCQKPREATSGLRKACKPQGWGLGQRGVLSSTGLSWTAPGGRHNQSATPSKLLGYVERGRIPTASRTNIFLHRILIDIHSFSKQMQPRRE